MVKKPLDPWRSWRPVQVIVGPNPEPGTINKADAVAIKAVAAGEATPEMQRRAIEAIVNRICSIHELSFRAEDHGGTRETDFAEGKRFVGLQVRKVITTPLQTLTGEERQE
jgi:hypothetical protein